jgi:hypothetical protein
MQRLDRACGPGQDSDEWEKLGAGLEAETSVRFLLHCRALCVESCSPAREKPIRQLHRNPLGGAGGEQITLPGSAFLKRFSLA